MHAHVEHSLHSLAPLYLYIIIGHKEWAINVHARVYDVRHTLLYAMSTRTRIFVMHMRRKEQFVAPTGTSVCGGNVLSAKTEEFSYEY